jgi:hypothetical protein
MKLSSSADGLRFSEGRLVLALKGGIFTGGLKDLVSSPRDPRREASILFASA